MNPNWTSRDFPEAITWSCMSIPPDQGLCTQLRLRPFQIEVMEHRWELFQELSGQIGRMFARNVPQHDGGGFVAGTSKLRHKYTSGYHVCT